MNDPRLANLSSARLSDFRLLENASEEDCEALLQQSAVLSLDPAKILTGKLAPDDHHLFLLQGEVEFQESGTARFRVHAGSELARDDLSERLVAGTLLRALDRVEILAVPVSAIAGLAQPSDGLDFTIEYTPVAAVSKPEEGAKPGYTEQWMQRIQSSPLMTSLSDADVQRCFMELERVDHQARDKIISIGEQGEYFYILLQGQAEVLTDVEGPFAGESFDLEPGDYFGEEALVARTRRNATVRMKSDGTVGRLNLEQFESIFCNALVQTIGLDKAKSFLEDSKISYCLLDLRSETEYETRHVKGCRNVPIETLRKEIANLNLSTTYLVTPAGDRRSNLGVFLLRQAGLTAYILTR